MKTLRTGKPKSVLNSFTHTISRNLRKHVAVASVLALGFVAQPVHAALTFTFNYLGTGGFNDPTHGAARQAALNSAASMLGSYFTGYTANLVFDVTSINANSGTLASAGSGAFLVPGSFERTITQEKILTGVDGNGAGADGSITWNFFHNWSLTDTVSGSQFDFKAVAMHELMHAFGFTSFVGENGEGLGGGNTAGTPGTYSVYDQFLTDSSGNSLFSGTGIFDPGQVGALTSNGVEFNGPNATAANGGNPVSIFSPNPWDDGSSIAHLAGMPNALMSPSLAPGLGTRTLNDIELGILMDIGYTSVVPLPAAAWLFLSGVLAMFGISRRQRRPV